MASYNGNALMLGVPGAFSSTPLMAPLRRQRVAFPGVDGLMDKPLGAQGGKITARGLLAAPSVVDLNALEALWFAAQNDSGAYTFVDERGRSWQNAVLIQYHPLDSYADRTLGYCIEYECEFDVLY